jgi:probable phosphoglycerate mutase
MTKIYLVRHGEAEGNLYRRMQGQYDSDLTELGYRQAEAVGQRFREIPLDAVYSSDLFRAMYTASCLCLPKGLPLYTDRRFREIQIGSWEDVPFGTAWKEEPQEMQDFVRNPDRWRKEGAETYRELAERGYEALMEVIKAHPGGSVAICMHNYLIGALLCRLFYGFDHYEQVGQSRNTAVTLLSYDQGAFQLVYKHDASHLEEQGLIRSQMRLGDGLANVHFAPMGQEIQQYIDYRKDAWQVVYGDLRGFDGAGFWMDAQRTMGKDPEAMVVGYLDRTPIGVIQLSPDRDAHKKVGYIPFIYLREPFRHKGLGIQLIGHSVSFYRKLGREKLQLSVAPTNEKALGFYYKFGFQAVGKSRGRFGKLILMEKDISAPKLPKKLKVIPKG